MRNVIVVLSGILFGLGLSLAQMIDRMRVLDFLDIAALWSTERAWDPTLALVLGGAVAVTLIMTPLILRRPHPLLSPNFSLPTRKDIDKPLVMGAAIFGVGWGIAGYCPGPGISALVLGIWNPIIFLAAMLAGSLTYRWYSSRGESKAEGSVFPQTSGSLAGGMGRTS